MPCASLCPTPWSVRPPAHSRSPRRHRRTSGALPRPVAAWEPSWSGSRCCRPRSGRRTWPDPDRPGRLYFLPIDVQFLGDHHGQQGANALAQFRVLRHDGDGVVRIHHDEVGRLQRSSGCSETAPSTSAAGRRSASARFLGVGFEYSVRIARRRFRWLPRSRRNDDLCFSSVFFFFMIVLPYLALPAPPPDAPGWADASCAARWIAWRILK